MGPLQRFTVTVDMGGDSPQHFSQIQVNRGDEPGKLAENFCAVHQLDAEL
jgi:hypothetical protein